MLGALESGQLATPDTGRAGCTRRCRPYAQHAGSASPWRCRPAGRACGPAIEPLPRRDRALLRSRWSVARPAGSPRSDRARRSTAPNARRGVQRPLHSRRRESSGNGAALRTRSGRGAAHVRCVGSGFGSSWPSSGWSSAPGQSRGGKPPGRPARARVSTRSAWNPAGWRGAHRAWRQVRSARLGPIGRDGRAPGGRVAHRRAFGSAARVVGRAGGVRRTTPRRREPPSAVGLCRPDAQAGCRRHWACDIPSIASTTRYAGRVARTARRRGQRAAHERPQVRRGGPRRVAGTTKCRPHVWHVGSGSSCTARLLAKHGVQQVQVRTLSADRRRRCEPAGAAGGLGERSQLAEGNRPIGLGAQRLERLLPRKTEATSARLVVGRKRCRRHWRRWKRQGCLDQSPYLDDGQPSTYGEAGQLSLAGLVAQRHQQ